MKIIANSQSTECSMNDHFMMRISKNNSFIKVTVAKGLKNMISQQTTRQMAKMKSLL